MFEVHPTRSQAILATIAGTIAGASRLVIAFFDGASFWSPAPTLMIVPAWFIGGTLLGDVDLGHALIPFMGALFVFSIRDSAHLSPIDSGFAFNIILRFLRFRFDCFHWCKLELRCPISRSRVYSCARNNQPNNGCFGYLVCSKDMGEPERMEIALLSLFSYVLGLFGLHFRGWANCRE